MSSKVRGELQIEGKVNVPCLTRGPLMGTSSLSLNWLKNCSNEIIPTFIIFAACPNCFLIVQDVITSLTLAPCLVFALPQLNGIVSEVAKQPQRLYCCPVFIYWTYHNKHRHLYLCSQSTTGNSTASMMIMTTLNMNLMRIAGSITNHVIVPSVFTLNPVVFIGIRIFFSCYCDLNSGS